MINLCMPLFSKNICGEKILFNGNIFVEATRCIANKAISIKDQRINYIGELDEFKPGFTIINASDVSNERFDEFGMNSETFIIFNMEVG